jgi:predicted 3-demethylubiquinone-9 3-methyltransferase (glyoxalase superfamily)
MASVQKLSPFLMFDGSVDEPAKFYVSVFPNSEIKSANPMSATIVANGTEILMFNGGSHFKFTPGISLFVKCADQEEVDLYWNKFISGGGREDNCGWLQDKWGVSWQIIPDALSRYLGDANREKANRVMQAMMKMKKIIVADLDHAYGS